MRKGCPVERKTALFSDQGDLIHCQIFIDRDAQDAPHGASHHFFRKGIGASFRKKDCLDTGCRRTSKDRPHIAGVLHRIQ